MTPKATTIQEIYALLDSVQHQLKQIRERAKELAEPNTNEEEGPSK